MSQTDIDTRTLAQEVAKHLPGRWKVEDPTDPENRYSHYATIRCHSGGYPEAMAISMHGIGPKISVSGHYPWATDAEGRRFSIHDRSRYAEGGQRLERPSINVSRNRAPEAIARDIERRLLDDVQDWLKWWVNTMREAQTFEDESMRLRDELAEIVEGYTRKEAPQHISAYDFGSGNRMGEDGYMREGTVSGPNSVRVHLDSLSAEKARAVLLAYMDKPTPSEAKVREAAVSVMVQLLEIRDGLSRELDHELYDDLTPMAERLRAALEGGR